MRVPARGRPHCLHRCSRRRNVLLENLFFLIKMEKTGLEIVSVEEVNETSPAYEKCPWISQVGFHSFFSFFFIFENQTAALRALTPGLFLSAQGERETGGFIITTVAVCAQTSGRHMPKQSRKISSPVVINFWLVFPRYQKRPTSESDRVIFQTYLFPAGLI